MSVQMDDLELLAALRDFVLSHDDPAVDRFKAALRNWGDDWIEVTSSYLPAADILADCGLHTDANTRSLLEIFERHKQRLHWEQSYKKEDAMVPDSLLAAYGFAEIIGQLGPFVSERIRAGVGIWGPGIVYPRHRHQAEEIYIVLAGCADFTLDEKSPIRKSANDVVYVPSNTPHGFCTQAQPLVTLYCWQAGDLRQISSFD